MSDFSLKKFLNGFEIDNYFRYSGSLTTPDCDEIVEWIVIESPILTVSEEQLLEFQEIQDNNGKKVSILLIITPFIFYVKHLYPK